MPLWMTCHLPQLTYGWQLPAGKEWSKHFFGYQAIYTALTPWRCLFIPASLAMSVSMECPDGRKKLSLKENTPSVYLMSTLERDHHTRESELAPRGSQSKSQEACKSLRLKPWFPAHSPTEPSSPGPQDHLLSNPPGWTPQRFPTSWSARDLSSVFFLRSLFSLARWHTSAPKPTFLALP